MTKEETRKFLCKQAYEYHAQGDEESMNRMLDQLIDLDTTVKFAEQVLETTT